MKIPRYLILHAAFSFVTAAPVNLALGADLIVADVIGSHIVGYEIANLPATMSRPPSEVGGAFLREGVSANSARAEASSWILNPSKTNNAILETEQYANASKSRLVTDPDPIAMSAHLNSVVEWTVPLLATDESIIWNSRLFFRIVDGVTLHRASVENITQSLTLLESTTVAAFDDDFTLDAVSGDLIRISLDVAVERSFPPNSLHAGNSLTFKNRFEVVQIDAG